MSKTQYSYAFIRYSIVLVILLSCFALTTTAKPNLDHNPTLTRASKMKIQIEVEGSEKIATLPHKLSAHSASKGYAGKTGDLSYYAPWGNLAIFYKDSEVGYANGLIFLGKMEDLPKKFLSQSEFTVVIRQVKNFPMMNK